MKKNPPTKPKIIKVKEISKRCLLPDYFDFFHTAEYKAPCRCAIKTVLSKGHDVGCPERK